MAGSPRADAVVDVRPQNPRGGNNKPGSPNTTNKGPNKDPNAQARADALAAEKRAVARAEADKKKAGKRFLESAANLALQAQAIRQALTIEFASSRNNNLADIDRNLTQELAVLKSGASRRAQEFMAAGADTERASSDTAERGFSNLVRERQDSLTSILEQGAGETDAMRALVMSARNWHSNAAENNRTYFDTMRNINAGITDLNVDTQSALANAARTAEGARETVWQDYYDRRGQAFTQLGNVLGQQAEYYAQAKEMGVNPPKGAESAAEKAMRDAFNNATIESGKSYTQQGLPEWISRYQGQDQLQARQSNTNLGSVEFEKMAKAEGATLRKWDAA